MLSVRFVFYPTTRILSLLRRHYFSVQCFEDSCHLCEGSEFEFSSYLYGSNAVFLLSTMANNIWTLNSSADLSSSRPYPLNRSQNIIQRVNNRVYNTQNSYFNKTPPDQT
uniref:Uncharacterized protein n=1 Tax=Cacopsylla melanoneura TaxID=428564 RepID=A0A8D9EAF4_9HEMI